MKNSIKVSTLLELLFIILSMSVFISCIKEKAQPTQTPIVYVGPGITIIAPQDSVELSGSVSDPMGTIVSYEWTQLAGPSQTILVNKNNRTTIARNLSLSGLYVFELKVIDNRGLTGRDSVDINVLPIGSNPVCNGCWDY
jgi:hypothetical protein